MPSSKRAFWPTEWKNISRVKWYFGLAWIFVLFVVCISLAAFYSNSGSPNASKYFWFFSAIFLTIMVLGWETRVNLRKGGVRKVQTLPDGRLAMPYSRVGYIGSLAAMVLLAAVTFFAAFDCINAAKQGGNGFFLGAAVFGLATVVFLSYPLQVARGKIRNGCIILSGEMIEHRSWGYMSQVPWENVNHISALITDGPAIWLSASGQQHNKVHARRWVGKPPMRPGIAIEGKNLAVDPAFVYGVIKLLLEQPSLRAQMSSPDSSTRLVNLIVAA